MSIPKRGEIWVVDLDPASGHEQQKARPCLVISATKFNQLGLIAAAPITSGGPGPYGGFTTEISKEMGLKTYGRVLAHQVRSLDFQAREATFVETAPADLVADVVAKYAAIIGLDP